MEIKEAVEILKNEQLDIFDGRYGKAFKVVREALRNGYTLCKVDEAVERIENNRINETFVDSSFYTAGKCIEIIKEACK